jgi:methionyl-tRNA formyltransferase
MRSLIKYVFIQDDPFYLPRVLDKYLREFADSTVGVNVQSVSQGKRTVFQTAIDLYKVYGPRYFAWKTSRYAIKRLQALVVNDLLRSTRQCYSVTAVCRKYGVPVTRSDEVNSEEFRRRLRALQVELIVSISSTRFCGRELREQTPKGIINCHGGLLPRYRGLMPSFWTLANGEREGGVTVHYVDGKIDNGPIIVQRRYRIRPQDTLEEVISRSKDLAAEAIIEAVRLIEQGAAQLLENDPAMASTFSMPSREDAQRFRRRGHRFF